MRPTLHFSRNYNPRLAVATARHLRAPVDCRFAAPFDPAHSDRFRKLNPSLLIPILEHDGVALWEADAIACRLSQMVGSEFWRSGSGLPDMIRWLSWGHGNFVRACDLVHFERVTRRRYALGALRPDWVAEGLARFATAGAQLDTHLGRQDWLLPDGLSYADFRMACVLPFADIAGLPLADFPAIAAWHDRLMQLPEWADPFAGLDAPPLPDLPALPL